MKYDATYVLCNVMIQSYVVLGMRWDMNWLVGWTLVWDYNAWDSMWNDVGKRVSWETLGDGVVSVYLDIGDV